MSRGMALDRYMNFHRKKRDFRRGSGFGQLNPLGFSIYISKMEKVTISKTVVKIKHLAQGLEE